MVEPRLKSYRNDEFIGYIKSSLELLTKANIPALSTVQTALQAAYDELELSFKINKGSLLTATIQELDARRDAAIRGILNVVRGYSLHYDENIKSAAFLIERAIVNYGRKIYALNYQAETSTVQSLVNEFENDADLVAALTLLNMTGWKDELKTANTDFENKYLDRISEDVVKDLPPVSELRPVAIDAYYDVLQHIQANNVLNPSPDLTTLTEELERLAEKYNQIDRNKTTAD